MMTKKNKLTLVPVGGLANRMRAIDSAIALAKDSRHELEIVWFKDQGLNARFCDLFQPFELPGVTLKEAGWWDKLLLDRPRKKNLYLPGLSLKLHYDAMIGEKDVTDLFYQQFDFRQWAEMYDNIWIASYIYFYPIKDKDKRYHVFRPTPQLQQQIEERCLLFDKYTVGVHIRRTDNTDSISQSPTDLFIKRMEEIVSGTPQSNFYLATDSEDEKILLNRHFKGRIQYSHSQANRKTVAGIQEGLVEMYALSRTSLILGSLYSSYSSAASLIGNIRHEEITKDNREQSKELKEINIALATDDNYLIPTTVAIQSIFNHHRERKVIIHLCYVGGKLREEYLKYFMRFITKQNGVLYPLTVSQNQLMELPDTRHGKAALLRLFLPDLLPHLSKILYLDGDIIVNDNLTELYDIDLADYLIAASKDTAPIHHPDRLETIGIESSHWYFNSGVTLLNLQALRKVNLLERTRDFARKYYEHITSPDQDVLNYICQGHTYYIHPRYNMNYLVEKDVAKQTWGRREVKEAKASPAIIHYIGPVKPWAALSVHPQRNLWWKVLKETPFNRYTPPNYNFTNKVKKCYLLLFRSIESIFTLSSKRMIGSLLPSHLKRNIKKSANKDI